MTKVNLSNGQVLNFPDEMSQDEIHAAIQKNFPSPKQQEREMPESADIPFFGKFPTPQAPTREDVNKMVREAGTFMVPGGFLKSALQASSRLPLIGNAIKTASQGLKSSPALNALSKIGEAGAEGGLVGAAQSTENKLQGGALGAGLGSGANILTQLARTSNPMIAAAARSLLGAG